MFIPDDMGVLHSLLLDLSFRILKFHVTIFFHPALLPFLQLTICFSNISLRMAAHCLARGKERTEKGLEGILMSKL